MTHFFPVQVELEVHLVTIPCSFELSAFSARPMSLPRQASLTEQLATRPAGFTVATVRPPTWFYLASSSYRRHFSSSFPQVSYQMPYPFAPLQLSGTGATTSLSQRLRSSLPPPLFFEAAVPRSCP